MLKRIAVEAAVVTLLLVVVGFFYLRPASTELLRGNATVMVGDGTDSVTNPWQYQLVLDVARSRPQELAYAALYSDQMNAPEGAPAYIPWIERALVLSFAPFMSPDLMPTAMVWTLMVLSGLAFHAYGRLLGWNRAVAFALAIAWAFCPFTRARSVVHIAFVGTYWAPLLFLALHLVARPPTWLSTRAAVISAAALLLVVFFAAHYFVIMAAIFAPLFLLYYLLVLPRSASRLAAIGRLGIAVVPAVLFALWSLAMPLPPHAARALAPITPAFSETSFMLKAGGAHPSDYVLGDVKFGTRDIIPMRARLTAKTREEVALNRHERTNGIRWSVLACCAFLVVALAVRRSRRRFTATERVLAVFAVALGVVAFLFSLAPDAIHAFGVDLGPIQIIARYFPRFRVPNRIGVLVHFAALLGAGVLANRVLRKHLQAGSRKGLALGVALPALMVLDYPPLHEVPLAAIRPARFDLEASVPNHVCGAGMTVPYVTWGFRDEEYYEVVAELRGTSCKIIHTSYLTTDDQTMRIMVGEPMFNQNDRMRAVWLTRCTNASWLLFRLDVPEEHRRKFCADVGFTFIAPDACRAPPKPEPVKSLGQCLAEIKIVTPPELVPSPQR